jgi:dienelactone hydrolase
MTLHVSRTVRGALKVVLCVCVMLLPCRSVGQPAIVAKFLYRAHTFQGTTLGYRLFVPEGYSPSKRYPVVLTLHGGTFEGSDNVKQIAFSRLATSWADSVNQAKYPCFVVSPQARTGSAWVNAGTMTRDLETANNILDSLAREFSIDTTRMYVTGLSLGGQGTWCLITRFPERFAAAIPVSGQWWWPSDATCIADMPLWVFIGALDQVIPVGSVREMIHAFLQLKRNVVYTHCNPGDCTGLSDSVIAACVQNHADLFYTETCDGVHDIAFMDFAYDYPFLRPWLFDKVRIPRGHVMLTNVRSFRILHNAEPITWTASNPSDSVEIRFSPDLGSTWQTVSSSLANTGSYMWDTRNASDCAFGLLRIYIKDASGQTFGYDQSGYFAVDNGVQGKPYAKILNLFSFWPGVTDSIALKYLCGSSKQTPVSVQFYYSSDDGITYTRFDGHTAEGDTAGRTRMLDLTALPNSDSAVLRVDVIDKTIVSSDSTSLRHPFVKRTPRTSGPVPSRVSGSGGAVAVHVVDASKLTGEQYRVSFHTSPPRGMAYDVRNESKGISVVQDAPELNGTTEGPLFDGIRLLVRDYPSAVVDRQNSGWELGSPTLLDVQISVLQLTLGDQKIDGHAYPADYRLSFFDHIVDTSHESILGPGRLPVDFRVWNVTENRKSDFVFVDGDNNQHISSFDEICILEPDSQGILQLTWDLLFVGVPPATSVPGPGDQFLFRTLKPIRSGDAFTFQGIISSVRTASQVETLELMQNYPNPFNPTTVIRYQLPVAADVLIAVYDVLGREVSVLVNERKDAGVHEINFDARGIASGVYFYRIQAGRYLQAKKLVVLK